MDNLRIVAVKQSGDCFSGQYIGQNVEFEQIYREYFRYVLTNARRLRPRSGNIDVDDIVQDVFVVVYRKIEIARHCNSIRGWLFQILQNVIRGYQRSNFRRFRRRTIAEVAFDKHTPMRDTERLVMRRQAMSALQRVPIVQRNIYLLYQVHGMNGTEIARVLSLNVHTVRSRIHAAQRKLRRLSPFSER